MHSYNVKVWKLYVKTTLLTAKTRLASVVFAPGLHPLGACTLDTEDNLHRITFGNAPSVDD